MSDNPINVIEAAIRSAFTSFPKEDDPDCRSPHWIKPDEPVDSANQAGSADDVAGAPPCPNVVHFLGAAFDASNASL